MSTQTDLADAAGILRAHGHIALSERLLALAEQPAREPVAWLYHDGPSPSEIPDEPFGTVIVSRKKMMGLRNERPLVFGDTTPQAQPAQQEPDTDELTIAYMSGLHEGKKRKPWVGLTDEEIDDIEATWEATQEWVSFSHATRVIEAKLKEKNT